MSLKRRKRRSLFLLDSTDTAVLLSKRLASREWWAFMVINGTGLRFLAEIERRHYAGKASRDFEMLGFPFVAGLGVVGIVLAHKRRLTVRELARHFDKSGLAHEAETLSKYGNDLIVLAPSPEVAERTQGWLMRLVQGETVGAR